MSVDVDMYLVEGPARPGLLFSYRRLQLGQILSQLAQCCLTWECSERPTIWFLIDDFTALESRRGRARVGVTSQMGAQSRLVAKRGNLRPGWNRRGSTERQKQKGPRGLVSPSSYYLQSEVAGNHISYSASRIKPSPTPFGVSPNIR